MTFQHILVPLDGSRLAEDVLPAVEAFAAAFGSRVTLLHVLERAAPELVHGEHHVTAAVEGAAYLGGIADQLNAKGFAVDIHVHDRQVTDVAVAIESHAHEYSVDLIAMCKHGHSGFRQRILGGIAQQILRGGSAPILLRSPREDGDDAAFVVRDLLVPLDLQHDAEATLSVARQVARALEARVHLLTAVPSLAEARRVSAPARLLPSAAAESLRIEQEEADVQLRLRADELADAGVDVRVSLRQEEPAQAILEAAETIPAGLIVLGTHARAGFEAWFSGSTGERVLTGATQALLLIREL